VVDNGVPALAVRALIYPPNYTVQLKELE